MIDIIKYWILDKNYTFFPDIYFSMDIMMGTVRADKLTSYFGSIWSRASNRKTDTSTERACQPKWWHKRMETKRIFLNHFQPPRFASGHDQNPLIIANVSKENKHRVVPVLMIIVPKWDKRNNQRKSKNHFRNYWTRITGWLTVMPKVIKMVPKARKVARETEHSISSR